MHLEQHSFTVVETIIIVWGLIAYKIYKSHIVQSQMALSL